MGTSNNPLFSKAIKLPLIFLNFLSKLFIYFDKKLNESYFFAVKFTQFFFNFLSFLYPFYLLPSYKLFIFKEIVGQVQ